MKQNFDKALEFIFKWEGGYVDDPADPGGRTIYGISVKAHPEAWKDGPPTKEQAKQIYKELYWDRIKGDELPDGLDMAVFDAAVNMGTNRAIRILQEFIEMPTNKIDGVIGQETLQQLSRYLVNKYGMLRVEYYKRLIQKFPKLQRFEKGWMNRVNDLKEK